MDLIDSLKWPFVALMVMAMAMAAMVLMVTACLRSVDKHLRNFDEHLRVAETIAIRFVERDTLSIARSHATAIKNGSLDAMDNAGKQSFLSYLFWCPTSRRRIIEGNVVYVEGADDD